MLLLSPFCTRTAIPTGTVPTSQVGELTTESIPPQADEGSSPSSSDIKVQCLIHEACYLQGRRSSGQSSSHEWRRQHSIGPCSPMLSSTRTNDHFLYLYLYLIQCYGVGYTVPLSARGCTFDFQWLNKLSRFRGIRMEVFFVLFLLCIPFCSALIGDSLAVSPACNWRVLYPERFPAPLAWAGNFLLAFLIKCFFGSNDFLSSFFEGRALKLNEFPQNN